MKLWKRNAVVAAIVLFVCAAVYLNWSYSQEGMSALGGHRKGPGGGRPGGGPRPANPLLEGTPSPTATPSAEEGSTSGTSSSYFDSARLNRQQARDSALSLLQEAAADTDAGEEAVAQANEAIQAMAAYTIAEANIENLVTAKGYTDCVAFLSEDSISVVTLDRVLSAWWSPTTAPPSPRPTPPRSARSFRRRPGCPPARSRSSRQAEKEKDAERRRPLAAVSCL